MDLITALSRTVSQDQAVLQSAQTFLEQAAVNNFPEYLKELSNILQNATNDPITRTAAGLQLKNALTSKDHEIKLHCQQKWLSLSPDIRNYVKSNVITALGTETNRPSSAAQCVAYIAVAELPHNMWPEIIHLLTQNVTNPNGTEMMKEATLEAIGYICQDIEPDILASQSNEILTAIVHGMRKEVTSNHLKLAATNALLNSLEFSRVNFYKDSERHFIMQVVCETTQSEDIQVKVAALQCLVKIMSLYYQYMEHYMGPALFAITVQAMKSDIDEVALQGIEFWSNVCDEEVNLAIEASEASEQGRPPTRTSRFYAKGALRYLVPILMQTLTKQEEYDDDDDWNPNKAAGVCLMLMASCCEDDIIPHVMPFVNEHIKSPDWRCKDAAVMAFGSILEGPDVAKLKPIVEQALPMMIELMRDKSVIIRDTTAWTIGRICELIPDAVINSDLDLLINTLINGLSSESRVAANICWAINSLAEAAYEHEEHDDQTEVKTYCLSKHFFLLMTKLLEVSERPDGNQANLRSAAYEAIMELIKNSAQDCYPWVKNTSSVILQRLQRILSMENQISTMNDLTQYSELQSLLCATLQAALKKMTPEDAPQISDAIMTSLLQMCSSRFRMGTAQEDALTSVGTLVEVLGEGFLKYMPAFAPFLAAGLKNVQEHQVCNAAVGLVSEICRAIGDKIMPYCDDIMSLLLQNLSNNSVHRSVKPQILSVFGDIALAVGPEFKKYLEVVLNTLMQASQYQADRNDHDLVDYMNELRENCLQAYSLIVQGLKGDKEVPNEDVQLLRDYIQPMVQFLLVVASDLEITDNLIAACAGLVGDLLSAFGSPICQMIECDVINKLLNQGRHSRVMKTRLLAIWAQKEVRKMRSMDCK